MLEILRHFQAFSAPEQNPALKVFSTLAHTQVTQTVNPTPHYNKIVSSPG
jgi:hypothetical protein